MPSSPISLISQINSNFKLQSKSVNKTMKKIILASSSPYRRSLLEKLNIPFTCVSPNIDETPRHNETAKNLALRLAKEKALALQNSHPKQLIIASDQVASFSDHILGKPGNKEQTIHQLKQQSAQCVEFFTSIYVLDSTTNTSHIDIDICKVYFKTLSEQQITNYVNIEKPYDCAGGFKSEGLGIALFDKIEGEDPNALIGLPLIKLVKLLEKFKIRPF